MNLFRTKSIEQSIAETDEPEHKLRRDLGALDLIVFGVAVIVGAGIFITTGRAAAIKAGPAITISFIIAAICCGLAALCYAEFASTVPVAGSAYTYSYASLGELIAWIIGWDLVLELALGSAVVAKGWSGYLLSTLDTFGLPAPEWFGGETATFDFGAFLLVAVLTGVLAYGTKLSSRVSLVITSIKVTVVLLVIVVGAFYIKAANYTPFVPPSRPAGSATGGGQRTLLQLITGDEGSMYGYFGVFAGASLVFFAFIGFDIVATTAEEVRNPQRDMPRGIFGSLLICTVLYCGVALVITGMTKYTEIDPESSAPLADAFVREGLGWAAKVISIGGLAGLTTVVMVLLLGQTRVLFAMSRDHLLPAKLAHVNPRTGTPFRLTLLAGAVIGLVAALVPIGELEEMVNIGTLFAFIVVSVGVVVLRRTRPELPRAFRTPAAPVVATLSVGFCIWLMLNLTLLTWARFVIWMVIGLVLYFAYGVRKSRLAPRNLKPDRVPTR
jgi:APA family basic amino acid/polyamine antiporter